MESNHTFAVRSVLILKADKLYAHALRQLILSALPKATVRIATSVADGSLALAAAPVDLLLTGLGPSLAGDALDLLSTHCRPGSRLKRAFVVTANREPRQLEMLRKLAIHGVFDSMNESAEQLVAAVQVVATGGSYWSQTFLSLLRAHLVETRPLSRLLTAAEELLLTIVGDGSDDSVAARELGLSPATISTMRRSLHRKLGVQHRGELIRMAAQNGFVRFTPSGVIRPGFALLVAAYHPRKRRMTECFAK